MCRELFVPRSKSNLCLSVKQSKIHLDHYGSVYGINNPEAEYVGEKYILAL